MDQKTLANMRSRVDRCRKLAETTTDPRTAKILRQMADEGEADIRRMETEQQAFESNFETMDSTRPTVN